jgi:alginate O-acetyltransferase complex protein AlgI
MTLASLAMLIWIGVSVALCWLAPRPWQTHLIQLMSALFLGVYSPLSLLLLLLIAVVSHSAVQYRRRKRAAPAVAIFIIAALLVGFKRMHTGGADIFSSLVMPLGLSFYALRAIHYCIEGWKGSLPLHNFREYLNYLFFMPTLLAGPINRFDEFQRGVRRRRWDPVLFSTGCQRILYGYVKIVYLAMYLVSEKLAHEIGKLPPAGPVAAWLECLQYGLNLYFQFSGYSDVAIGFGLLLGIRISENFNYPFLARNISDFWKRWHISLTSWCRDYIYLPVLSITRQPRVAVISSMLVLGFWHELSLRYVCWALYHGIGITLWHGFQELKGEKGFPPGSLAAKATEAAGVLLTLNFVILSFAITKEPDVRGALAVYTALLGMGR